MLFVRHTACQQKQVIVMLLTWNCLLLKTSIVHCNGSIEQKLWLQNILCWTWEWVRDMNSRTLMCIVTSTLALKCLSRITSVISLWWEIALDSKCKSAEVISIVWNPAGLRSECQPQVSWIRFHVWSQRGLQIGVEENSDTTKPGAWGEELMSSCWSLSSWQSLDHFSKSLVDFFWLSWNSMGSSNFYLL